MAKAVKKVPKGLKDLFDNPEGVKVNFDVSDLIEGTIKGKTVKIMHHKIKGKSLYSYKVNDYRFSPALKEKDIAKNLKQIKAGS